MSVGQTGMGVSVAHTLHWLNVNLLVVVVVVVYSSQSI